MKNKNTTKDVIDTLFLEGKSSHYIIGTLQSMLDGLTSDYNNRTAQEVIDGFFDHHTNVNKGELI
jgi:hypothetical protein